MAGVKFGALGALLILTATTCANAATFSFQGNGGLRNSYEFSSNGIDLTVTAGTFASDGTVTDGGFVGQYSWGLGATTRHHDSHQVDGYRGNDVLVFEFSRQVRLSHFVFSYVDNNDDFRFFHDTDHDGTLSDFGSNIAIPSNGQYVFNSVWDGALFGIGAKGKYDNFKIEQIYVTPVPLPAALPLLLAALGFIGLIGRRRRQRDCFAAR